MDRLTNDKTAQDLKDICEGFEAVGQAPAMTHLRYVKLAEYEQTGYDPEEIRDILKSVDAEREPPKEEIYGKRENLLCWSKQGLYPDGFGGARVGYTCPYCKQYVPYAGKYCGKCGKPVQGGEDDA